MLYIYTVLICRNSSYAATGTYPSRPVAGHGIGTSYTAQHRYRVCRALCATARRGLACGHPDRIITAASRHWRNTLITFGPGAVRPPTPHCLGAAPLHAPHRQLDELAAKPAAIAVDRPRTPLRCVMGRRANSKKCQLRRLVVLAAATSQHPILTPPASGGASHRHAVLYLKAHAGRATSVARALAFNAGARRSRLVRTHPEAPWPALRHPLSDTPGHRNQQLYPCQTL